MHQGGNVKQELKHEPVSTRVKLKILPHLLRSRLAAECFPANIQVGHLLLYAAFVYSHSLWAKSVCQVAGVIPLLFLPL